MLGIRNKKECVETINRLGLNRMPEQFFDAKTGNVEAEVESFMKKFPFKFYCIRDKARMNGVFKFDVPREDVLREIKGYEVFTINVSSSNYAGEQIFTGDIEITADGRVFAILSFDPAQSVRGSYSHPDCIVNCNIFDDAELNKIPEFDFVYEFLVRHNLIGVVVELSLFKSGVGTNHERILIWELRDLY